MAKNNFYYKKLDKNFYFVSNETGNWKIISKTNFKNGKINILTRKIEFINYKNKAFTSPSLHIIGITDNCNHSCKYCRAINYSKKFKYSSMSVATLIKTINFIFNTPSTDIAIEFQGGEPLLNWKILKTGIEYIYYLNQKFKKNLIISMVSNLSLMDKNKLDYLISKNISICTSLDGNKKLHDQQRIYSASSSYKKVTYWLKKALKISKELKKDENLIPSALMTTTRYSLNNFKEIVNEYYNLGLGGIFVRELSPIGYTKYVWDKIGYEPEEFLEFYENTLDYILELNMKGIKFIERNTAIRLKKLLALKEPNFLDLKSPCGAVIGQLAYDTHGNIYTCDEGRIVAMTGDKKFKIGNVYCSNYRELLTHPITRECIISSFLENQIECQKCAFKHYCGICPVHNYERSKSLYGSINSKDWCKIQNGIFKIILKKMANRTYKNIFIEWLN